MSSNAFHSAGPLTRPSRRMSTGRTTSPARKGSIMIAMNPTHAIAMMREVGTFATGRRR